MRTVLIRRAIDDLGTHLVQRQRCTSQRRILLDDDDLGGVIDVGEIHPVVARLTNDGQGSQDEQADDGQTQEETTTEETTPELSLTPAPASTPES